MQELKAAKENFCPDLQNVDISGKPSIINVAMIYTDNEIDMNSDNLMFDLQKYLRYEVLNKDKCSSLLKPQDISLQKIFIDGRKQEKWVFVAKLDSTSEDGYLKSELPHCKALPYLPSTNLEIKPYLDIDDCCKSTKDKSLCEKSCMKKLKPLKHKHTGRNLEYSLHVYGAKYDFDRVHESTRRRRLLQHSQGRC